MHADVMAIPDHASSLWLINSLSYVYAITILMWVYKFASLHVSCSMCDDLQHVQLVVVLAEELETVSFIHRFHNYQQQRSPIIGEWLFECKKQYMDPRDYYARAVCQLEDKVMETLPTYILVHWLMYIRHG